MFELQLASSNCCVVRVDAQRLIKLRSLIKFADHSFTLQRDTQHSAVRGQCDMCACACAHTPHSPDSTAQIRSGVVQLQALALTIECDVCLNKYYTTCTQFGIAPTLRRSLLPITFRARKLSEHLLFSKLHNFCNGVSCNCVSVWCLHATTRCPLFHMSIVHRSPDTANKARRPSFVAPSLPV